MSDYQRQLIEALAMIEFWRTECEQQRTYDRAELAESKAEANKVTQSMGSEILRLQCELEQQRTRAEAAEQELRDERQRVNSGEWVEKAHAETLDKACKELEAKLAAARAHLPALKRLHAWVSSDEMGKWTYLEGGTFYDDVQEMTSIVADALEALES